MAKRRDAGSKNSKSCLLFHPTAALCTALLGVCLILLCACGTADTPGTQQTSQAQPVRKKKKMPKVKPIAKEAAPKPVYIYDATGKPDPFIPLIAETEPTKVTMPQQVAKPITPLQRYNLNDLKLVAVISKQGEASALLEDSAGFGYIVKRGMLVGKNEGVIKKIIDNGIIVEERIYNAMGDLETKISTLTIQHE